jgi:hypothetical protein
VVQAELEKKESLCRRVNGHEAMNVVRSLRPPTVHATSGGPVLEKMFFKLNKGCGPDVVRR